MGRRERVVSDQELSQDERAQPERPPAGPRAEAGDRGVPEHAPDEKEPARPGGHDRKALARLGPSDGGHGREPEGEGGGPERRTESERRERKWDEGARAGLIEGGFASMAKPSTSSTVAAAIDTFTACQRRGRSAIRASRSPRDAVQIRGGSTAAGNQSTSDAISSRPARSVRLARAPSQARALQGNPTGWCATSRCHHLPQGSFAAAGFESRIEREGERVAATAGA